MEISVPGRGFRYSGQKMALRSVDMFDCFAITAPGIESLTAAELEGMGVAPSDVVTGGVAWTGPLESVYAANLHLRTASRIIVRIAGFRARTFAELERHAKRVPWDQFLRPAQPVRFRISTSKSRLYHTGAIAQRLADIVGPIVGDAALVSEAKGDDEAVAPGAQLFLVRIERDAVSVSADSSGALLHRRGYRQNVAKAPLRETLAAAMVLASRWDRASPLVDPMCGSGTIPIEAIMIARKMAPGLGRRTAFACLRWPNAELSLWNTLVARAKEQIVPRCPVLVRGSDRDAGAANATLENAERAGVAADLEIEHYAVSHSEPAGKRGWLLTNPPYGVRVGDRDVRNLYAQLGKVTSAVFPGWVVGILTADPALAAQTRLPLQTVFSTKNGGIPVRFVVG